MSGASGVDVSGRAQGVKSLGALLLVIKILKIVRIFPIRAPLLEGERRMGFCAGSGGGWDAVLPVEEGIDRAEVDLRK